MSGEGDRRFVKTWKRYEQNIIDNTNFIRNLRFQNESKKNVSNDNMITDVKPDKFIYRAKLFEILNKHFGSR